MIFNYCGASGDGGDGGSVFAQGETVTHACGDAFPWRGKGKRIVETYKLNE